MKYLLPHRDPTIRTYLDYAFLFGIRNGSPQFENFLFGNYASLCFVNSFYEEVWDPFDFFPAPRLKQAIQAGAVVASGCDMWRTDVFHRSAVIEYVRGQLAAGRYLYVVLDEYYIPRKESHRNAHFIHHSLVAGLDLRAQTVGLLSYFKLGEADYGLQWVPLSAFLKAFDFDCHSLQGTLQEQFYVWNHRYLETIAVADDATIELNVDRLRTALRDYLNSTCSPDELARHNKPLAVEKTSFGLAIYDRLDELLEMMQSGRANLGFHPTRLFTEHKLFMLERARWLETRLGLGASVLAKLEEIVRLTKEIRFHMVAACETKSREAFAAVQARLRQCRELELQSYPALIRAAAYA